MSSSSGGAGFLSLRGGSNRFGLRRSRKLLLFGWCAPKYASNCIEDVEQLAFSTASPVTLAASIESAASRSNRVRLLSTSLQAVQLK
jgi:hypothetical protein